MLVPPGILVMETLAYCQFADAFTSHYVAVGYLGIIVERLRDIRDRDV